MGRWKGWIPRFAMAALGALILSAPLRAATAQIWRHRSHADREQGTLKGVSLLIDGSLTLGPALETLAEPAEPYVWSLAADSKGNVYAGGGSEGKVFRLDKDGRLSLFFDAEELEVHALAVDAMDHLYVGTSPSGKIYRVDSRGQSSVFFSPGQTYIWSLVFDRKGNLYAGTGTEGKIFRIPPSGKGEVFRDTDETHVRVLTLDGDGALLAGTEGKGLLLRIDESGRETVVTHAPLSEVTALVAGPDGRIYFAAAGQSARAPLRPSPPATPPRPAPTAPQPTEEERPPGQPEEPAPQPAAPPPQQPAVPSAGGAGVESRIISVEADGYPREIWSVTGDLILSLALDRGNSLIAGAGSDGKIYRIDPVRGDATLLNKADSSQISALLPEPGGALLAAGSNLGAIYRLGGKVAPEGTYESTSYDAKVYSAWGKMAWRAQAPSGSSVRLQVRTGNTSEPDATWSDWSPLLDKSEGSPIDSPRARFVQWRATLKSSDGRAIPRLGEVDVNYLQRNLPPEVKALDVQPPGVVFQKPGKAGSASAAPGEGSSGPGRLDREKTGKRTGQQPRPQPDREGRAAQWTVSDPNGDEMIYSIYYRGVGEKEWKLMDDNLTDPFFSWDST
ncbi:MAG TPA: hypothetical protein VKL61_11050, partial [Candidatus Polarisedimenticolia bacterium]|nr:hypothetical protein [Candidatus Polarisedimenticolia bacterium]